VFTCKLVKGRRYHEGVPLRHSQSALMRIDLGSEVPVPPRRAGREYGADPVQVNVVSNNVSMLDPSPLNLEHRRSYDQIRDG
jgi:hypothetical protein